MQHPDSPAQTLMEANDRILADTRSDQFVTVFYGVLDLVENTLIYTNAGHNPPILLHADAPAAILDRTGIPLGMFQNMIWQERTVSFAPQDTLMLYTDGISEAQNVSGDQIGARRLLEVGQT
ncbi:MAG TPA: PP2C family protein-serine/threonine phosphatase, partial [Aggregatilineaceae bacterium]|nr:PP2C family protein-serine/threonine phosphatase [Aggregatilineaceae bacterium]